MHSSSNTNSPMAYPISSDMPEEIQEALQEMAESIEAVGAAQEEASYADRRKAKQKKYSGLGSGKYVQYTKAGRNFMPTVETAASLPPAIYRVAQTQTGGIYFESQPLFTDKILRLPDSKGDAVITEIERFWTLRADYEEYGLSYKRGFLLHGPPGSGKTCTIALIIEDMIKRGGIVIIGQSPGLLAIGLSSLREVEPDRPLVVILEDLDAIVQAYGEAALLSLLDGESQIDNVVYIATTNYPEDLDGRITNRPSRFDSIVHIDVPNDAARKMYLESRLGAGNTVTPEGLDLVTLTKGLSIAHLRELIVGTKVFGHGVEETIERLKKMKITPKSGSARGPIGLARE